MSETQATISAEIEQLSAAWAREGRSTAEPHLNYPPYRSSLLRHPNRDLHRADPETVELYAPVFGDRDVDAIEADLTIQRTGMPLGERMVLTGRVLDGWGRPVAGQLVEIWQANSAGRYWHQRDQHDAPLDDNFIGAGRCITGPDGSYRFTTIRPGPYPWRNHRNAWRPSHIHFSLFGTAFSHRLVTQMYFPGDPLFPYDPIMQSVVDPEARARMVCAYDPDQNLPETSTAYRWDIVLTGSRATLMESS